EVVDRTQVIGNQRRMIEENDPAIRFGETVDAQFPAEQEKKDGVIGADGVPSNEKLAPGRGQGSKQEPKARRKMRGLVAVRRPIDLGYLADFHWRWISSRN